MVIRNFEKKYIVTQTCGTGEYVTQYFCYEFDQKHQIHYRIAKQLLVHVMGTEIGFLTEQIHKDAFMDFVDYFTEGDALYVLTRTPMAGSPLAEKLEKEICSLQERLEIMKNILEKIILQELPDFFLHACMDVNRIYVEPSGVVAFDYDMEELYHFADITFLMGKQRLAQVLNRCFQEELHLRTIPELHTLLVDIQENAEMDMLQIYNRFWKIYQMYFRKPETELQPQSFWFRLWERIKDIGRFLKKLVRPLLLFLAFGYLAFSIYNFLAEPEYQKNFERIGKLSIMEQKETDLTDGNGGEST